MDFLDEKRPPSADSPDPVKDSESPAKEKEEEEEKKEDPVPDGDAPADEEMDFDLNNLGGGGMTDEEKAALDEKLDKMKQQIEDILARALFKEETKSAKGEEGGEDELKEAGEGASPEATFHSANEKDPTKTMEEDDPAARTGQSKVTFSKGGGGISEEQLEEIKAGLQESIDLLTKNLKDLERSLHKQTEFK